MYIYANLSNDIQIRPIQPFLCIWSNNFIKVKRVVDKYYLNAAYVFLVRQEIHMMCKIFVQWM